MAASQEFRDGAASGAEELRYRLAILTGWGVKITPEVTEQLTHTIIHDMGGHITNIGARMQP